MTFLRILVLALFFELGVYRKQPLYLQSKSKVCLRSTLPRPYFVGLRYVGWRWSFLMDVNSELKVFS